MLFAYLLCITFGLMFGSFRLLRLNIILSTGDAYGGGVLTDTERALSFSAILFLLLSFPVIAAIFYPEPWVLVDNFVTGKDRPVLSKFSFLKTATFFLSVVIGELLVEYYQNKIAAEKQSKQKTYQQDKPEYEYKPVMEEWQKWRRQTANSGHPDWTAPNEDEYNSNAAQNTYSDPMRVKNLRILNLDIGASAKEINKQYLKMAKLFHPDMLAGSNRSAAEIKKMEDKMKSINAAYDWLKSNP